MGDAPGRSQQLRVGGGQGRQARAPVRDAGGAVGVDLQRFEERLSDGLGPVTDRGIIRCSFLTCAARRRACATDAETMVPLAG